MMQILDISQEVFSCQVYPGDRQPQMLSDRRMARGDSYNLSSFQMCAHNGTHVDAPFHFFADGLTVDQLSLTRLIGPCYVAACEGALSALAAQTVLQKARQSGAGERILLKGDALVTPEAAQVWAQGGLCLLGCESQSVGPIDAPAAVHRVLLKADVVLLEGLRLAHVDEGVYELYAAPLCLGGADGAPCRAVLIKR